MRPRVHFRILLLPIFALALAACSQEEASTGTDPAAATTGTPAPSAGASAAAPAFTPAQQAAWAALLARLDRDGDGVIARAEHATGAAVTFSRMDRDGNNAVTVEEMDAERGEVLATAPTDTARRLAEVDINHDGTLDSDEHEAATRVMFDRYDRNGDARLVREEFMAVLAQLAAAPPAPSPAAADSVH